MGKLVIIDIGEGSFESGFPVKIRVGEKGKPHTTEINGRLPAASNISQKYSQWQSIYWNLPANWLITIPTSQITNVSTKEACQQAACELKFSLNEWLNHPSVRKLERELLLEINDWQNVRLILQTQDSLLRRLPWHLWDICQLRHPQPEIVVSSEYKPFKSFFKSPVRILVVLGHRTGINIQQDLEALQKQLLGAIIEPLIEPSSQELRNKLWSQLWDIFFFAGHSSSFQGDSSGKIDLNSRESLSLLDLHHTLRYAVNKGLKLAIFNSCDGLGLARNLADLRIPYTIVMREPVPDKVAQHFLQYFLTAFVAGESLYTCVQQARARLHEELEDEYPCASWLPVIFQNPAAPDLRYPQPLKWKKIVSRTAIAAILVGCFGSLCNYIVSEVQFLSRFSSGDKILIKSASNVELNKKEGVQAFGQQDYPQAAKKFAASLQQNPHDPETLIYLNNAQIGTQRAVKIGVAVPTGSNPNVAQEILRGVAQAQQEINNQGGIHGKLLQVVIANDDNHPEIAKQIAQRFVKDKDIVAVVGHNSSDASVPASDIYQSRKLVMISPTSSSLRLTERIDRIYENYIYRTVINFSILAESLTEYVKTSDQTRILICSDSKAADQSFGQEFIHKMWQKNLQSVDIDCNFAAENFQPEAIIRSAQAQKVDAIFLNPQVDRIDQAIALAKANQGQLTLLGNPSLQTKKTLEVGEIFSGMVMAVPWEATTSPNREFVQNADKLWGDANSVTWRTATAFDAMQVVIAALKQKGNTRTGVQQALAGEFLQQGATGTIQFLSSGDRWGDRIGTAVLVEVQPDSKAPSGFSFVPKDSIQSRISLGDKILIQENTTNEKQVATQAFAVGDYDKAISYFQASLKKIPNDPEAQIYLQNSLAARSQKALKIAVSVPIGSNLNVAKEMLQGVAQAQYEINQKGLFLQLIIASDDNNSELTKQIAKYFVADKKILAVIGHNASDASIAACPIYQQGSLVNISPTSFSRTFSGCGSYIFRTAPNIRFLADTLYRYAIHTNNIKKFVICVDEKATDNQSFRDDSDAAIIANGGKIININCDLSASEFNPNQVITDAIGNGAEGLVLAPHVDRINKALDLAAANQGKLRLFASPTLYTSQTLQQGQTNVSGLVLAVPWHPKASLNTHAFKDSSLTWRSATSYDAAIAIMNGLQQSKTREGLQKILHSPSFSAEGATGEIQFLQSGDRLVKNNPILVEIQPSSTSPHMYDFFLK